MHFENTDVKKVVVMVRLEGVTELYVLLGFPAYVKSTNSLDTSQHSSA